MSRKKGFAVILSAVFFISFLPSVALCGSTNSASFDKPIRDMIADSLSKGKGICTVVGDMIKTGKDTSETVRNAILMGHPACVVVRCAVETGAKLEEVIIAAFRAGATSDIIVTCAVDGGADHGALARAIERLGLPGLGYTPPPIIPAYTPTFAPTIGGGGGGRGTVSPFSP